MTMHGQETVALTHAGTLGLAAPREISVPRQLGAVRLIREIGRGGMGVVWLGHNDMLGRDVAVKFQLGASMVEGDPEFATFLEGARAAAKLRIPGITAVHHADVIEGSPYIVMEHIDGPTVARVASVTSPTALPAAWAIMHNVCTTVADLHEAGIIHRDIKPSNVMLDDQCRIYLTDFGVALLRPDIGDVAMERANLAGTPAYMAPEMFDSYASARSDTYALGIMFYELLAGKPPFAGSSLDEMKELHRTKEPDLSPLLERKIETPVIDIIARALRKDPKFRFKTGRHMLEAMDRAAVPAAVRIRAASELRSAALRCRTAGNEPQAASSAQSDSGQRNLYDHMATIAAKKRANPQTPPPKAADSALFGLDSDSQPERLLAGGVRPEAPGGSPLDTPPDLSSRVEDDDAPIKPITVAWIGLGVFVILSIALLISWLAGK
jgi:serine/threonine protein kinase